MITITPMMPQREAARHTPYPHPPMRGILAVAWVCAAMSVSGLFYSAGLYMQEKQAPVMEVSCR